MSDRDLMSELEDSLGCKCGRIKVGGQVTESRNWNPDCPMHGLNCQWKEVPSETDNLIAENERLIAALERISNVACGIPGHSVAVGCTAAQIAYEALGNPHQHRWVPNFDYFSDRSPGVHHWKCLLCEETSVDDPRGRVTDQ